MKAFLKKLKYIEIKKRYVVLVVLLAVIVRFWGENSITMLQKEVPLVTSTEISEDEINRYIETKQAYINENIQVSNDIRVSRDLEQYLDNDTHEWFLVRGWRPKRFFYTEDRILLILKYIHDRMQKIEEANNLENRAQQLSTFDAIQASSADHSTSNAADLMYQAQNIRYYIDREIRMAGISIAEDNAVSKNLDILEVLVAQ